MGFNPFRGVKNAIKKGQRSIKKLQRTAAPFAPVIGTLAGVALGGPIGGKVGFALAGKLFPPVTLPTSRQLQQVRSRQTQTSVFRDFPAARASQQPLELLVRQTAAWQTRFKTVGRPDPIRGYSNVDPLYSHLNMARQPVISAVEATRQPIYDLLEFERRGQVATLAKTFVGGPGQAASFQFTVPDGFSMELVAIGVDNITGPVSSIFEVRVGWIGGTGSVRYSKVGVAASDAPEAIFGIKSLATDGRWSREVP